METEVADFAEAGGEHVLQEPAEELLGFEAECSGLVGPALPIAQCDQVLPVVQDGGFSQSDAVDVLCEVGQGALAGSHRLGMHHPVLLPDRGVDLGEDQWMALTQRIADDRAERF